MCVQCAYAWQTGRVWLPFSIRVLRIFNDDNIFEEISAHPRTGRKKHCEKYALFHRNGISCLDFVVWGEVKSYLNICTSIKVNKCKKCQPLPEKRTLTKHISSDTNLPLQGRSISWLQLHGLIPRCYSPPIMVKLPLQSPDWVSARGSEDKGKRRTNAKWRTNRRKHCLFCFFVLQFWNGNSSAETSVFLNIHIAVHYGKWWMLCLVMLK